MLWCLGLGNLLQAHASGAELFDQQLPKVMLPLELGLCHRPGLQFTAAGESAIAAPGSGLQAAQAVSQQP
ncbi:MAG: hypothetical protein CBD45_06235 [Synechococcus sp. TMED185]|nr:MAG: hypothetical protein CBD45_06235 [Synechococcus sp. TMED185]